MSGTVCGEVIRKQGVAAAIALSLDASGREQNMEERRMGKVRGRIAAAVSSAVGPEGQNNAC